VGGGERPAEPRHGLHGQEGKGEELGLRAGLGQRRERARRGEGEGELGLRRCWATGRGEKGVGLLETKRKEDFPFMNYDPRNLRAIQRRLEMNSKGIQEDLATDLCTQTPNKLRPKTNSRTQALPTINSI